MLLLDEATGALADLPEMRGDGGSQQLRPRQGHHHGGAPGDDRAAMLRYLSCGLSAG